MWGKPERLYIKKTELVTLKISSYVDSLLDNKRKTKKVHSIKSPPAPTISLANRKLQGGTYENTFVDNLFFRQVDMFLLHMSFLKAFIVQCIYYKRYYSVRVGLAS